MTDGSVTPLLHFRDNVFPHATPEAALAAPIAATIVRKNQKNLTAAEQQTFKSAITKAIQTGSYSSLVQIHAQMRHRMHTMNGMGGAAGTQRFLPWHRDYLMQMETELRHLEPTFAIPYWDWTVDQAIPAWLQGFLPTGVVDAAGQPVQVTRSPGTQAPALPTPQDVANTLAQPTYTNFSLMLEGARPPGLHMHNLVHVWVGGTMALIPTAPADPLFWLNHAQIDRIWAAWELNHPAQHPALTGSAAVLDPWPQTATDMQSIASLGYQYA